MFVSKWAYINVKNGDMKRITSCTTRNTALKEFMEDDHNDVQTLPAHLFLSTWQHDQMNACIHSLQPTACALVMDYSENYSCSFRDESQNALSDKNQVTLHSMMLYYKPPESPIVKHAIIAITDDSIKDPSAVQVFESEAIAITKSQINLHHVHRNTKGRILSSTCLFHSTT